MMMSDSRKAELHALEAELHGIELELSTKTPIHRSLSIAIDSLEADKNEVLYRIYRLKREARQDAETTDWVHLVSSGGVDSARWLPGFLPLGREALR